jgi:CRP-like cAMP-binding protein
MFDARWKRIGRELAVAAFGVSPDRFDPWVLDRFTDIVEEEYVGAGQVLWPAGKVVETLYFMHDGRVQAIRRGAPPWTMQGHWFLGAFEGHLDRPAPRSLVALSDFSALKFRRTAWLDLLEDSFDLRYRAVTAAATAVAQLDERMPMVERPAPPRAILRADDGPLTMVERIAFFTEIGVSLNVGVQALADLANVSHDLLVKPGTSVFAAREANDHFFLVVDGEVEATRKDPDVRRRYAPGETVIGAAALSERRAHWAARAVGSARLLAVPIEAWFDLMEEHFELANSTLAVFARDRERILEELAAAAGPEGIVLT